MASGKTHKQLLHSVFGPHLKFFNFYDDRPYVVRGRGREILSREIASSDCKDVGTAVPSKHKLDPLNFYSIRTLLITCTPASTFKLFI
jgi:hypothetical protein